MLQRCLFFVFVLLAPLCWGQESSSVGVDDLYFAAMTTADGLPSQNVYNTYQDREGYMWISTEAAVVRFDGYSFIPYYEDLSSGVNLSGATNFYEDNQGQLWAINAGGFLHRYDRDYDEFIRVPTPLEDGWAEPSLLGMTEDQNGNLWISGYGGLQYYDRHLDSIIVYPLEAIRRSDIWPHPEKVRLGQIYIDGDKAIWAGTRKFGLVRFDLNTKEYKLYRFEPGFLGIHLDDWITDMTPVQDGYLMISDFSEGLIIWDMDNEEVIDEIKPARLMGKMSDVGIRDLYYEGGSQIWIATEEQGLIFLNYKSKTIISQYSNGVNVREDSPGDMVTHINRDKHGLFWVGSNALLKASNLQYRIEHLNHVRDEPFSLRHDRIYWMSKDPSGGILISTDEGLSIFNPQDDKFDNSLSIIDESVRTYGVYADNDYYWIGNYTYLNKLDKETKEIKARYKRDIVVDTTTNIFRRACRIIKDSQDVIWTIDHWGRIKRIDERSGSISNVYELAQDPVTKRFINVIAIIDDPERNQIIAATDYGLATVSYDGTQVDVKNLKYNNTDLTHSIYSYLYRDHQDDVWVVIDGRVYRLDVDTWTLDYLALNESNGIGSFIWIVDDSQGIYWLASFKGILRFNPADSTVSTLYTSNIGGYKFESSSPVLVDDYKIYFSGGQGLSVLDTRKIIANESTNPVVIIRLDVNQVNYNYKGQSEIDLGYQENDIDVSFSTLDFIDQQEVKYQYRLLPRDDEWIDNETNHSLKLYNLEPDKYKLELKGANADGFWHPTVTALEINISPPWWDTAIAKFLAVLVGIGLMLSIQRYLYQQKIERQQRIIELRDKISRDLHDDVGTLLTGVAMQSELLEMTASGETQKVAEQIAGRSRQAMSQLRDTVWAMDSSKDGLDDLRVRIIEFADDALVGRDIEVEYQFEIERKQDKIPPNIRQALYLISKESITNISKHSDATELLIKLSATRSELVLNIHDNGTQQDNVKSSGVGITNMTRRATDLNGTYSFSYDNGYVTRVVIPDPDLLT